MKESLKFLKLVQKHVMQFMGGSMYVSVDIHSYCVDVSMLEIVELLFFFIDVATITVIYTITHSRLATNYKDC